MISNFEEKSWDIDIKNITVSHSQNTKCNGCFCKTKTYFTLSSLRTFLELSAISAISGRKYVAKLLGFTKQLPLIIDNLAQHCGID